MAHDLGSLLSDLEAATDPRFRGRLLSRGQAQSMVRRDGVLPEGAPSFDSFLDDDLIGYGYSLVSTSLRIIEGLEGADYNSSSSTAEEAELITTGLIQASYAIEAATRNRPGTEETAFHRLTAGAASHLAGYAARAYSLVRASRLSERITPMEQTLADLLMRSLADIEQRVQRLRTASALTDGALVVAFTEGSSGAPLGGGEGVEDDPVAGLGPAALLLTENYLAAVSAALFAIEREDDRIFVEAVEDLQLGLRASNDLAAPGPWWIYRLTRRVLEELAQTSIAAHIPTVPPANWSLPAQSSPRMRRRRWRYLRNTFVAALAARDRAEIDLWPSQLHVVDRVFNGNEDLVVALPTSAGKTRIAELCILSCIAQGRRVVYVTPLRALSAQTEQVLDRSFGPLGVGVSSLYGSMGANQVDEDTLRSSQIVVATPEKVDFALRSDPTVLDDVGLMILDEGHMIGPSGREVRYEAQIQRLLRRADASTRRMVCLSAVFPSGDDLDDFVAWVTDDLPDGLHREQWRPTLQRFGLVEWRRDHARLSITLGEDRPFVPRYLEAATAASGQRKKPFPDNQRELVIATAWRLIEEGQTALIFCPQRNSVEPYARDVIKLHRQGFIESALPDGVDLSNALMVGAEWFGADHPILECLKLGVAIHHGALPGPFRREVERLLQAGGIKVTVASPTLAQGLNLSASTVLFHGLHRGKALLTGAEFTNVIGRAGRAFVDTEGLVLCPLFEPTDRGRREWLELSNGDEGKALRSGLIEVCAALIRRIHESVGSEELGSFLGYLTGGWQWALPVASGETAEEQVRAAATWQANLALLDVGLLSIVGDDPTDFTEITELLAEALRNSLWERQLRRLSAGEAEALRATVVSRAQFLWASSTPGQRRGWYLAGLGANDGAELGQASAAIVDLTVQAEAAISSRDDDVASVRLIEIAAAVFAIPAFRPTAAVENWQDVLASWVTGKPLGDVGVSGSKHRLAVVQFIESDLVYRLVWGMEAARVYEAAQGNLMVDVLTGSAPAVIETGTLSMSASILIRAGFDHRLAAIAAVEDTDATFDSVEAMRAWLDQLDPALTEAPDWPTLGTHAAWLDFVNRGSSSRSRQWVRQTMQVDRVRWVSAPPPAGSRMRVTDGPEGGVRLWSPGCDLLGVADVQLNPVRVGVLHSRVVDAHGVVELLYRGPEDLIFM
ncbi:MAG TPA: DEAD/DEAH box helicase [Propionibacteriaceae bacterium]|nr:DEAD/DEAH box helicase [Propionibacteriaceae bacterium]